MLFKTFATFVVFATLAVHIDAGDPPSPSPPSCTYSCPPADDLGFTLGPPGTAGTATDFQCSYPAVEGEDPDDFYCLYSKVDGHLTQDHDAGLCPAAAVQDCSPTRRRRRNALPRSPRSAGPGARSPKPEVMKTRSKLAAMKHGLANQA